MTFWICKNLWSYSVTKDIKAKTLIMSKGQKVHQVSQKLLHDNFNTFLFYLFHKFLTEQ